ncbi:hypothetical protein C8J57DRAFT_1255981 [Mycena rebaudengoi]|nr:hypothetical protein C8J57DRAFT_1255981 [Mycena rebaudengoi]
MSAPTSPTVPSSVEPAPAPKQFSFGRGGKTIAISTAFAENGVRPFHASMSAPPHDLRKDGSVPSSAAFTAEQNKDAARYAALNLETRDAGLSLRYSMQQRDVNGQLTQTYSSQMRRDFAVAEASPTPPPGFATGPSSAGRLLSRTVSLASEVSGSAADEGIASPPPILLQNHLQVSRQLHLAGPPTTKAGQREKPETALRNDVRRLESKIKLAPSEMAPSAPDARIGLLSSDIARLQDTHDTMNHHVDAMWNSNVFNSDGTISKKYIATQGDIGGLYDGMEEALEGQKETMDALSARLDALERAERATAEKVADVEKSLLVVRANLAQATTDFAHHIISTPSHALSVPTPVVVAAPAPAPSAPSTTVFQFSGKNKLKRKASIEVLTGPAKRTAHGKPDKSLFSHWVHVGPINLSTKNPAVPIFKTLLETAVPHYTLPSAYIERSTSDPSVLNVGFSNADSATGFVNMWAGGANTSMKPGLRAIGAETHLLPDDEDCLLVPRGYYAISISRKVTGPWERHGGGVTAFIRNNIIAKKSVLSSPDILVLDMGTCWLVGAYILPQSSRYQQWTDTAPENKLDETLSLCAAADDTKHMILLLDANARTAAEQ